jgi:hypothetical protein
MNRLILLAAVLASAGCSLKPQKTVNAARDPAYVFPHSPHVDGDVSCLECHSNILSSKELAANVRHVMLPSNPSKVEACSGCHDTDPSVQTPNRTTAFRVRFDHSAHLKKVKDCKACHQELPEVGDVEVKVPPMAACTSCHEHQKAFAEARCTPCHVDLKGYLPKTAFRHEGDWLRTHGQLAKPTAQTCAACHDQTSCAECHAAQTVAARPSVIFPEEVDKAFIHRGDYVARHTVEARANGASCRTCHGSAFCNACHTAQGVTDTATNVRDPHPTGWATDKGTSHFHGDAARRDILSCAGCHDNGAAATCVGCHQVGGVGGNPHPATFLRKHDSDDRGHNSMCAACHHGS